MPIDGSFYTHQRPGRNLRVIWPIRMSNHTPLCIQMKQGPARESYDQENGKKADEASIQT